MRTRRIMRVIAAGATAALAAPATAQCQVAELPTGPGICCIPRNLAEVVGEWAIVGAAGSDIAELDAGAVYVYRRDPGGKGWREADVLLASNPEPEAHFGKSIAFDGERMLIGASGQGNRRGMAYVFERDPADEDRWVETVRIRSPDRNNERGFGAQVAIDGNTAVVYAQNAASRNHRIRVFRRNQGGPDNWGDVARLLAGRETASFGVNLAVSGDTAVVVSDWDSDDNCCSDIATAMVFRQDEGGPDNWGKVAELANRDFFDCGDRQDTVVDIDGDLILVSANCDDDGGDGGAYLFERHRGGPNAWGQAARLLGIDRGADSWYGTSARVDGDLAVVGSFGGGSGNPAGGADVFYRHAGGTDRWGLLFTIDPERPASFVAVDTASVIVARPFRAYDIDCPACRPDRNADDDYTIEDICLWHAAPCDVDGDGTVDVDDLAVILDLVADPFDDCNANTIPDPCEGLETMAVVAPDADTDDALDAAVAVGDTLALVGSHLDDVNGTDAGAVFVFRPFGDAWADAGALRPNGADAGDQFGRSVAIGVGAAIVGSPRDDQNGDDAGAAYVYRLADRWLAQEARLLASDGAEDDRFGRAVAIDGDVAIVGADRADNRKGAAYVFRRGPAGWEQEAKLRASDRAEDDRFGIAVDVHGNRVIVGAHEEDDRGDEAGAAYVFRHDGNTWVQTQKLVAPDGAAGDGFGRAVAIEGDVAVVGASLDDEDAGVDAGSAWVFRHDAESATWNIETKLVAADGAAGDWFGRALAMSGPTLLVGAPLHAAGADEAGAVYQYRLESGPTWRAIRKLVAPVPETGDRFGASISLTGGAGAILAPGGGGHEAHLFTVLGALDEDGDDVPDDCNCPADFDHDRVVDFEDLVALLSAWGPCVDCAEDLDDSQNVGFDDLVLLLAAWGPCE